MNDREYIVFNTSLETASNASQPLLDEDGNREARIELRLPDNLFSEVTGNQVVQTAKLQVSKLKMSMENIPIAALPVDMELTTSFKAPVSSCQLDVYPYSFLANKKMQPEASDLNSCAFPDYKSHFVNIEIRLVTRVSGMGAVVEESEIIASFDVKANTNNFGISGNTMYYPFIAHSKTVQEALNHPLNLCLQPNRKASLSENGTDIFLFSIADLEQMFADALENAVCYASTHTTQNIIIDVVKSDLLDEITDPAPNKDIAVVSPSGILYYWRTLADNLFEPTTTMKAAFKPQVRFNSDSFSISYDTAPFTETVPIIWSAGYINTFEKPLLLLADPILKSLWDYAPPPKRTYSYKTSTITPTIQYTFPEGLSPFVMNIIANKTMRDTFSFLPWLKIDPKEYPQLRGITEKPKFKIITRKITLKTNRERIIETGWHDNDTHENTNLTGQFVVFEGNPIYNIGKGTVAYLAKNDSSKRVYYREKIYPIVREGFHPPTEIPPAEFRNLPFPEESSEEILEEYYTNDPNESLGTTTIAINNSVVSGQEVKWETSNWFGAEVWNIVSFYFGPADLTIPISATVENIISNPSQSVDDLERQYLFSNPASWQVQDAIARKEWDTATNGFFRPKWRRNPVASDTSISMFFQGDPDNLANLRENFLQTPTFQDTYWLARLAAIYPNMRWSTRILDSYDLMETWIREVTYSEGFDPENDHTPETELLTPNIPPDEDNAFFVLDGSNVDVTISPVEPVHVTPELLTNYKYEQHTYYTYEVEVATQSSIVACSASSFDENGNIIPGDFLNIYYLTQTNLSPKTINGRTAFGIELLLDYLSPTATDANSQDFIYGDVSLDTTAPAYTIPAKHLGSEGTSFVPTQTYPSEIDVPPARDEIIYTNDPGLSLGTHFADDEVIYTKEVYESPVQYPNSNASYAFSSVIIDAFALNSDANGQRKYQAVPIYQLSPNFSSDNIAITTIDENSLTATPPLITADDVSTVEIGSVETNNYIKTVKYFWEVIPNSNNEFKSILVTNPAEMIPKKYTKSIYRVVKKTRKNIALNTNITLPETTEPTGNVRLTFTWKNIPSILISPLHSIILTIEGINVTTQYQPVNSFNFEGGALTATIPIIENIYSLASSLAELHDELVVSKTDFTNAVVCSVDPAAGSERVLNILARYITKDGQMHKLWIPPNGVFAIQLSFGLSLFVE